MLDVEGRSILINIFNTILVLFGYMASPFCFLYQFYQPVLNANNIFTILTLSPFVGTPVNLIFYLISRAILKTNKWNKNRKDFRVFFLGLNAIFCGLAFYTPCCIKYIAPNFSLSDGILAILFVHLAGIGIASIVGLSKQVRKGRKL